MINKFWSCGEKASICDDEASFGKYIRRNGYQTGSIVDILLVLIFKPSFIIVSMITKDIDNFVGH